jgi:hypothetical protein
LPSSFRKLCHRRNQPISFSLLSPSSVFREPILRFCSSHRL